MAWGWLTSLFSSKKAVDTAVETVAGLAKTAANGIDVIFYTSEEKAQASQKAFDQWLELNKTWQDASTPMAIARRRIATIVINIWAAFLGLGVFAVFTENASLLAYVTSNTVELTWLVVCVFGFYFGPYVYDRYVKTK
jgi:hypothetical protein